MKPVLALSFLTLVVAVATLSVLYYQETRDDVKIKLDIPNVSIEKN